MDTFTRHWAPQHPLATDNPSSGVFRHPRRRALGMRHVQVNPLSQVNVLAFDVDAEDAARMVQSLVHDDEVLPEPNWIAVNPHTSHAHVGYVLSQPVTMTDAGRVHPQRYLANVQEGLRARLSADRAYPGVLTRNPLHEAHTTLWGPQEGYSLGDLHRALGDIPSRVERQAREIGFGRNCTLFDEVRKWAYREHRHHDTYDTFSTAVAFRAEAVNQTFPVPLSYSEVRSIVRSISGWVWRNFTDFRKVQSARGKRSDPMPGVRKRQAARDDKIKMMHQMMKEM